MNWWEHFTTWLDQVTSNPLVITITGILTVVGSIFIFLSKTSFGKKAIANLTGLYRIGEQKATQTLKKVEEVETLAKEKIKALESQYEQKANELKAEYEQKAATLVSIINYYEESVFSILEKIPNAKVQSELEFLLE